jgi:phosphoserine phosphatase RsbU/P
LQRYLQFRGVDETVRVTERIGRGAYPLGVKDGVEWDELQGTLDEGESLVFHSDGLTESRNPQGDDLGDQYLETIISWRPGGSATEIMEEIVDEWRRFCAGFPVEDDVTVAVIRRRDA